MKINKVCNKLIRPVFSVPLLVFGRLRKGGFVSGLIFGAVFSLVVNIFTVQIQETIQKQRVLEALENEIVGNMLFASSRIEQNLERLDTKERPNIYYSPRSYSREVWGTSEAMKFIVQLDSDILPDIRRLPGRQRSD
jgi:hypothetical protein